MRSCHAAFRCIMCLKGAGAWAIVLAKEQEIAVRSCHHCISLHALHCMGCLQEAKGCGAWAFFLAKEQRLRWRLPRLGCCTRALGGSQTVML